MAVVYMLNGESVNNELYVLPFFVSSVSPCASKLWLDKEKMEQDSTRLGRKETVQRNAAAKTM